MLNIIKLTAVTVFIYLLSAAASHAVVQLVDTENSGDRINVDNNITSGFIATGSGFGDDFEVIMCGTYSDGSNLFLPPAPDGWTTLNTGECGGSEQCILGIYGRFDSSPGSMDITCSWSDPTDAFSAGSFRYFGVDRFDPIIDVSCVTGGEQTPVTTPPVDAEPGSAVILAVQLGNQGSEMFSVSPQAEPILQGDFFAVGGSEFGEQSLTLGFSILVPTGESIPEIPIFPPGNYDWRTCAIVLRAAPASIPTLSEWGLGAFAALFGIAAVWALRRRTARA
ncbi:MAG TPA: IPTL-CTERM sorting domain-containing protein [Thermodesulfobacteriota bacterium]|nr:IPTL-CTERM sorting domain-containing protein [Thermodesulfobacteriota bacterium]